MDWVAEEVLRRTLPYGAWQWVNEDGNEVETLYNRKYDPIATRINGARIDTVEKPPTTQMPSWVLFNDGNLPWRNRATYTQCLAVLEEWGVDFGARREAKRLEYREERFANRRRWRGARR